MRHGSLFSGIGGFDLGFERAGIETIWEVEIDEYCRKVLAKHFPHAQRFSDIKGCGAHNLPSVDIISGGFPCQDISNAGKRAGIDGEQSGLWSEYARIIRALRPRYVVVENVAALLGRGMERVCSDLAACGYDSEWTSIRASDVGAPHRRERIWIIAYPSGCEQGRRIFSQWESNQRNTDTAGHGAQRELADTNHGRQQVERVEEHGGESSAFRNQSDRCSARGSRTRETVADSDGRGLTVQRESPGRGGLAARSGEVVAHTNSGRCEQRVEGKRRISIADARSSDISNSSESRLSIAKCKTIFGTGRREERRATSQCDWRPTESGVGVLADGISGRLDRDLSSQWIEEPPIPRVATGIKNRVNQLKGLGNAAVPQITEWIGRRIIEAHNHEQEIQGGA